MPIVRRAVTLGAPWSLRSSPEVLAARLQDAGGWPAFRVKYRVDCDRKRKTF